MGVSGWFRNVPAAGCVIGLERLVVIVGKRVGGSVYLVHSKGSVFHRVFKFRPPSKGPASSLLRVTS